MDAAFDDCKRNLFRIDGISERFTGTADEDQQACGVSRNLFWHIPGNTDCHINWRHAAQFLFHRGGPGNGSIALYGVTDTANIIPVHVALLSGTRHHILSHMPKTVETQRQSRLIAPKWSGKAANLCKRIPAFLCFQKYFISETSLKFSLYVTYYILHTISSDTFHLLHF